MSRYGYGPTQRPSVVTAASVLLYISAGFGIIAGVYLFGRANDTSDPGLVKVIAAIDLVLSVVYIVLATMILKGSNAARKTTIVLLTIGIVISLPNFNASSIVSIGLALLVIGLLAWNTDAQIYFGQRR